MQTPESLSANTPQWFVLRDLKRPNSKSPAYKVLPEMGFETFTPMHWVIRSAANGRGQRLLLPFIPSLLFVKSTKPELDEVVTKSPTLQYQFMKGAPQHTPMTVPMHEMEIFINAVRNSQSCTFLAPNDLTSDMIGRKVRIIGGKLNGAVGNLLKMRGSKKKRLILKLEGVLGATFEVESDYIELIND